MAADVGVQIEGLSRLASTMKRAGQDVEELKDAHARAGETVAAAAAAAAPRRSGNLAGSIRAARQARRARVQAGSSRVPYAAPIQWGWPARTIAANPFLSDAARSTEGAWLKAYLDDVQKALDKVKAA